MVDKDNITGTPISVADPDPTFYFDAYPDLDTALHHNNANLRPLVYRPTAPFWASIHISIVSLQDPPWLYFDFWATTIPEFWLWCVSGFASGFWIWCGSGSGFSIWCGYGSPKMMHGSESATLTSRVKNNLIFTLMRFKLSGMVVPTSVVNPDPVGSDTFDQIRKKMTSWQNLQNSQFSTKSQFKKYLVFKFKKNLRLHTTKVYTSS